MYRLPVSLDLPSLIVALAALSLYPLASCSAISRDFYSSISNDSIGGTNISTHNPSSCPHPTAYFRQYINHDLNTTVNNTFLQQYQIITDYYKPGGPILFYQGAENPTIACIEAFSVPDFAKELGALVVGIEHRYFGASIPYGLDVRQSANWTLEQWAALSLDNVLADSVELVKWVKATRPELEGSKVITFGGSYGAFLAGQLKIQYPDDFWGSIPTCGVYSGFDTDPKSSTPYAWSNWASNTYADLSAPAASKIRTGFKTIRTLMSSASPSAYSNLTTSLNLCTAPTSPAQTDTLLSFLLSYYSQNTQFGFSTPLPSRNTTASTFNTNSTTFLIPPHQLPSLINATLAAPSALTAIRASIDYVLARSNLPCVPWNSNADSDTFSSQQLTYINCAYFPYISTLHSLPSTIFGSIAPVDTTNTASSPTSNINDPICRAAFGIPAVHGNHAFRRKLGIAEEQLKAQTRMFFVTAQYDPVSAVGIEGGWWGAAESGDRMRARSWFVAEAAHTEDVFRDGAWDSEPLRDVRGAQLSYMKYWLGRESE